jgi:hypothetical protein
MTSVAKLPVAEGPTFLDYVAHELANIFEMIKGKEFEELCTTSRLMAFTPLSFSTTMAVVRKYLMEGTDRPPLHYRKLQNLRGRSRRC